MKLKFDTTPTSLIIRVKLMDSSATDGSGLTGLTFNSAGLIIAVAKIGDATTTAYTQAAGNIETIATLGIYAAPTGGKCRFKEYDAVNHKGVYEIQIADARFASTTQVIVSISGATNLAEQDIEIQIENVSNNTRDAILNAVKTSFVTAGTIGEQLQLLESALAGRFQVYNDSGDGDKVKIRFYKYDNLTVLKTMIAKKPDGTTLTTLINTNAIAGRNTS